VSVYKKYRCLCYLYRHFFEQTEHSEADKIVFHRIYEI